MKTKPTKQAKPVKAWAILEAGKIGCVSSYVKAPKLMAAALRREGRDARAVRVEIRVIGGKK